MSRHFLVDGYNVIRRMPRFDEMSLEDSRSGLIRLIQGARPQGGARNQITVIFDGQEGISFPNASGDIAVIFSRGESADDVIKRIAYDSTHARDLVLISDDRELQRYCAAMRAEVWAVDRFLQHLAAKAERQRGGSQGPDGKVIKHVLADRVNKELRALWIKDKK